MVNFHDFFVKKSRAPKNEGIITVIDTGEIWICPVCGKKLRLLHRESPSGRISHHVEKFQGEI
jgi:hypothetical protein